MPMVCYEHFNLDVFSKNGASVNISSHSSKMLRGASSQAVMKKAIVFLG